MARILVVIGSGETSPSMVSIHQELAAAIGGRGTAVILETPYGFQENVDGVSEKTRRYFAKSVGLDVHVVPGLRAPAEGGPDLDRGIAMVRQADWVFAGPGSPSYVARQWRGSPVGQALRDRLAHDGVSIFASAAACAIGRFALPVYEIYKVGMQPQWLDGLDLLSELGLVAAAIPHFNNAEGGTHDTQYCYIGERRFRQLEEQLPLEAVILGVDEHTAAIFDLDSERVTVRGRGGLTIRQRGRFKVVPEGSELRLDELRSLAGSAFATTPTPASEPAGSSAPPRKRASETTSLLDNARACEKRFDQALASRDTEAMVASILDLEAAIAAWSSDTLESDAVDDARAVLRSLVVRLGTTLADGFRERQEMAAMVELLVSLREELRQQRRFEVADAIRDALATAGIELQDTPEGSRWHRH